MTRTLRKILALTAVGLLGLAAAATAGDPIISEYIEGSSNNKAIEIYNPTDEAVNTGLYRLEFYFNGATTSTNVTLSSVSLPTGGVFVFAASAAVQAILDQADQTTGVSLFNGDDAVVLRRIADNAVIDSIGQVGLDPGTEWGLGLVSTADNTLVRKMDICVGDTNPSDAFDPAGQWDGYATDTFAYLGSHASNCEPVGTESDSWGVLKSLYR